MVALAAGGCASSKSSTRTYAQVGPGAYGPVEKKADVEADGLPPQLPPPRIYRQTPDDPREPYSPNYGSTSRKTALLGGQPLTTGTVTPVASLARLDEDAIMSRAILAHEQRYR